MPDKPIFPHGIDEPWQQLHLGIGEYVVAFSNMEGSITLAAAEILGHNYSQVAFFSRDMAVGLKTRLVRRVAQTIIPAGDLRDKLISQLNAANDAAEYRNRLLHGAFVHDDQLGITLVKDGNHPSKVWEGREPISYDSINVETRKVTQIGAEISRWLVSWRKHIAAAKR
jgi:hypothetical protein